MNINNLFIILVIFALVFAYISIQFKEAENKQHKFEKSIIILYRQAARWAAAALQDKSEIISLLHANYAAGYLWSIKDIVSTEEFKKITGVDFLEFENKIVNIQDNSTKKMIKKCC